MSRRQRQGGSLFTRVRNLETVLGASEVHAKFEGTNPTGTQKDRIAGLHYDAAHEAGADFVTLATCGNFGVAMANACLRNGVRPVVYVPTTYAGRRIQTMESAGARVVRIEGDYEAAVEASRAAARREGWYDANPGPAGEAIARRGYGAIAREILEELGEVPDTVAVPVGNGTTLAGIHAGFVALGEGVPRMIAASTRRGNPIVRSFRAGLDRCVDLRPEEVRETTINEPLTNWHAYDGDWALAAIRSSDGHAAYASDAAMRHHATVLREQEGLDVLPASTAPVSGLVDAMKRRPDLGEVHVLVLTGRARTPDVLRPPGGTPR